jgi:ER lumen protein retaining receptor
MAMNMFRFAGDTCHVASILLFLVIVKCKGNGAGISLRAHELYCLVFATRYLDIFFSFYGVYNSVLKIFFLGSTMTIIYTLKCVEPAKSTYSSSQDTFPHWKCASVALVVALLIHALGSGTVDITGDEFEVHIERYDWFETLWTFSICLEPFAMLPQLHIFWNNRIIQPDVRMAIFCKGIYRLFYIFNWFYRNLKEPHYRHHVLVYAAGGLQVLFYSDFFFYHVRYVCSWNSELVSEWVSYFQMDLLCLHFVFVLLL